MTNDELQRRFTEATGLTFDINNLIADADTPEKRQALIKKLVWLIPDGAGPDNTKEVLQRNVDFITVVADELNVELKDVFTDTDGDGDVDIYDVLTAPEEKQQWPKTNEIWYWGEYYDLENTISILEQVGHYKGPAVLSNELVGDKYVITFDGPVTKLGATIDESGGPEEFYPIFMNNLEETGIECNITKIEIPNSVTSIGYGAFIACSSLTSITIPNSVTNIEGAFIACSGLTSIKIPNNVTNIGDAAFYYCTGLTSIEIPDSVTIIGVNAFRECNSLASIIIGNSVASIGYRAFYNCTGLTSVNIPNSVTSIGEWAFYGCIGLESIEIPDNVTSIGDYAFSDCTDLTSIICKVTTPPTLGINVFYDTNNCPIFVPSQLVETYKTSWSEYEDRIIGLLNNNQIRYNAGVQLTIKDGVDYTEHTFKDGVGLVTFSNDLTTLGEFWFDNTFDNYTDNINSLILPNSVSSIGMGALRDTNTVYYEGTQKECIKISRNWIDGTGVRKYNCFDGIVDEAYQPNIVYPAFLWEAAWFKNLIGEETLNHLMYVIASIKISEHPMTAGEFITNLVNGTEGTPGLSTYGFVVENQEAERGTIPFAHHTESKHFIVILKANDYAYVDVKHFEPVLTDEALDPDYMYLLLDDTAIKDDPVQVLVDVTIEHEDKSSETVTLDSNQTYAGQGRSGYYSQITYDSSIETIDVYSVNNSYPYDGQTIYDYCNDIRVGITVYDVYGRLVVQVSLRSDKTFSQQGYTEYYTTNEYNSDVETPEMYLADNLYPGEDPEDPGVLLIYNDIRDVASDPDPDPEDPEEYWENIINDDSYMFDAGTITVGQSEPVTIDNNVARYAFTPENNGNYIIYSTGEEDTVGAIFDSNGNMIASNDTDDSGERENNFMLNVDLIGGETYYIHTTLYNYKSIGSFDLVVEYER